MAEGRSMALWGHTSAVLAQQYNFNRGRGKPPLKPAAFNPHLATPRRRATPPVEQLTREILKVAENRRGRG